MFPILIMLAVMAVYISVNMVGGDAKEKEPTMEDLLRADMKKNEETHKKEMAIIHKQFNELMALVTNQKLAVEDKVDFDDTINHPCHKCSAVTMGVFNEAEIKEFKELKDRFSANDGYRPITLQHKVRQMFIESVRCLGEVCPYTKDGHFLTPEYIEIRKNIEGYVQLQMVEKAKFAKKGRVNFPPLGLPQ